MKQRSHVHDVTIITEAQAAMKRACAEISTDMVMAMAICLPRRQIHMQTVSNLIGAVKVGSAETVKASAVCQIRSSRRDSHYVRREQPHEVRERLPGEQPTSLLSNTRQLLTERIVRDRHERMAKRVANYEEEEEPEG